MATDTGLNRRLRQHSRRAGLAVGLTMALTIAICIGGFAVIYAQLQPWISDFVSQEPPDDESLSFGVGRRDPTPTPTPEEGDVEAEATEEEAEEPEPTEPPPTPTPEGFVPDLQSNSNATINLRSEPSTARGQETVIRTLPPATPIQATGERAEADNAAE